MRNIEYARTDAKRKTCLQVMAFNSAGEGPESERYLERTFRKAPQKPPASVNVWAYNPTTVRVVWRYVQPTDEEEPLLGYKVLH